MPELVPASAEWQLCLSLSVNLRLSGRPQVPGRRFHSSRSPRIADSGVGGTAFESANGLVSRRGARHQKRSSRQPSENDAEAGGTAIAVGALLDGIPESIAFGLTMLAG